MPLAMIVNPTHKKRHGKKRHAKKRHGKKRFHLKHNPGHHAKRRRRSGRKFHFRRNPIAATQGGGMVGQAVAAAIGAGGALLSDVVLGYLPIPDTIKSGPAKPAVQAAAAVGLGFIAGKVAGRSAGRAVTVGGLTVVAYSLLRTLLSRFAPSIPLAGIGEVVNYPALSYVDDRGMGEPLLVGPVGTALHPESRLGEPMLGYEDQSGAEAH